jgi:hypothetical protein
VLALALVAVVACSVVLRINVQDESRTCQIRAFVHARLTIGDCIGQTLDRSRYHGRLYSNKAPARCSSPTWRRTSSSGRARAACRRQRSSAASRRRPWR